MTKLQFRSFGLICGLAIQASSVLAQSPVDEPDDSPRYVRRLSFGGRLSFLGLGPISAGSSTSTLGGSTDLDATSESDSTRFGGGLTTQFALTDRFAIGADALLRRIGYRNSSVLGVEADDPFTSEVEVDTTDLVEHTRANVWEFPLVLRYYNRNRTESGGRAFVEAGIAWKTVSNIRTFRFSETDPDSDCCDETPTTPAHRTSPGLVLGIGAQLNDDFGVRIIPQIRYTRWLNSSFDAPPSRTARNQFEVSFAMTF